MFLASVGIEVGNVERNFTDVEREVLSEAQLVRRVRQDRAVDHLRIAVALRLHSRGAKTEFGMLIGTEMILQNFYPSRIETGDST